VGFFLSQRGILFPSNDPTAVATTSSPQTSSATPTRTSQAPTPTPTRDTPTQTTPPAPETVNVIPEKYLGGDYRTVQSQLTALGLVVVGVQQESSEDPGTVLELNPTGPVPAGSTITVTYAVAPEPAPTTSSPATTQPPAATSSPTTSSVAAPTLESSLPGCTNSPLPGAPPTCSQ
jgi:eukaryotic-like serine/threonine-protein kinase